MTASNVPTGSPANSNVQQDLNTLSGSVNSNASAINSNASQITLLAAEVSQKVPNSEKAQPNGVATLDSNGQIPPSQLPATDPGDYL